MFLYKHSSSGFYSLAIFISLFSACMGGTSGNHEIISRQYMDFIGDAPKTVAIMPFVNETSEPEMAILARTSFYNHFSSKNFQDVELTEVDRAFNALNMQLSSPEKMPAPDFRKFFHTDYLVFGKVNGFKKIYLGIYSQIALSLELEIREVESGEVVWKRKVSKKSHDGGLPSNPLSVVPAAIRSGLHMKQEKTIELINRICREMVALIPDPSISAAASGVVEIQVASFEDRVRAETALQEFEHQGFKTRIETAEIKGTLRYRIILGPYLNHDEAENIKQRIAGTTNYQPIFLHRHAE